MFNLQVKLLMIFDIIHFCRSLMIREALILLNRLVSHPQYSATVLNALTATRDEASLTVEFANRLNQKSKLLWQDDYTTKQTRESEILDLARLFKKRVFTFLGDSISWEEKASLWSIFWGKCWVFCPSIWFHACCNKTHGHFPSGPFWV